MKHSLLSNIGRHVDARMLLAYLTEFASSSSDNGDELTINGSDWRQSAHCECIFMANAILYGSKDQLMTAYVEGCLKAIVPTSGSPARTIKVLGSIVLTAMKA